jgi:hypothetical protein
VKGHSCRDERLGSRIPNDICQAISGRNDIICVLVSSILLAVQTWFTLKPNTCCVCIADGSHSKGGCVRFEDIVLQSLHFLQYAAQNPWVHSNGKSVVDAREGRVAVDLQ